MRGSVTIDSPVGRVLIRTDEGAVTGVWLGARRDVATSREPVALRAAAQLEAYFAGELERFDLPLAPVGAPFHMKVWEVLSTIAYGTTMSYGEIARVLGEPTAARAVGTANARNPIPVILPCHRVIGSSGALTGYAGGLHRKRWLLEHEGALLSVS